MARAVVKMFKTSAVILLQFSLVGLLQAQIPTDADINAKIDYWNNLKEQNDLEEALKELDEIMKNPHPKHKILTLADFRKSREVPNEYNYVIVGGGTAGLVMANRLTEAPTNRVLVIERGGEAGKISKVPALAPYCCLADFADKDSMEPQPNAGLALEGGRVVTCKGKAIGGTSTINGMSITKGHPSDYVSWGQGWCYDVLLRYFKKTETANFTGKVSSPYHGFNGPLVSVDTYHSPLADAFISCGLEHGYKQIDFTAIFEEGFSREKSNTNKGRRQTIADAYLPTLRDRPNFTIIRGTPIKILIDDNNNAYGVQYATGGLIYTVKAINEVIVCYGVFGSPQLLMLSGIGPKADLEKLGINCKKDLPVGRNMHDQYRYIGIGLNANASAPATMADLINDNTKRQYLEGTGPLTRPDNVEAVVYKLFNSPNPNVVLSLESKYWAMDGGVALRRTVGISDDFYQKYFKILEGKRMFSCVPILKAKSVGQVKLRSTNPFDKLIIYGNYYSNPQDKKNMVDAIKFAYHLMKCPSFKKLGVHFYDAKIPGCENEKDDDCWYCAIKYLTVSHQTKTGTCKMGPANDPTSVVDLNLKVIGVGSLRVVGSAIIPGPVTGSTKSIRAMIAERAADLIKADAGLVPQKVCTN